MQSALVVQVGGSVVRHWKVCPQWPLQHSESEVQVPAIGSQVAEPELELELVEELWTDVVPDEPEVEATVAVRVVLVELAVLEPDTVWFGPPVEDELVAPVVLGVGSGATRQPAQRATAIREITVRMEGPGGGLRRAQGTKQRPALDEHPITTGRSCWPSECILRLGRIALGSASCLSR